MDNIKMTVSEPQTPRYPYKTLRVIDGKNYIELSEHEDLIRSVETFKPTMENLPKLVEEIQKSLTKLSGGFRES